MNIKKITQAKYAKLIAIAVFGLYYLMCFMLVIRSGYMYDDMWNYIHKGWEIMSDGSISKLVWSETVRWAVDFGRILIFSQYCFFMVCLMPLKLYKFCIVLTIFLDGVVIGLIVKELSKSRRLQYLVMLLFPAVVSLRTRYFSSIYGFHALLELCLLMVGLSVYWYILYRRTKKVVYQVLSCVAWFIALGIYEVAYILSILFIVVLFCIDGWDEIRKHFWKVIKTGFPHIIIFGLWMVANVIARHFATGEYDGTTFNMNLAMIATTTVKQASGGLSWGGILLEFRNMWNDGVSVTGYIMSCFGRVYAVFLAIFVVVYAMIAKMMKDEKPKHMAGIVTIGAILIILPSALIGLSIKYQKDVTWFTGYIPSYFASWGFTLLFACLILWIGWKLHTKKILYIIFHCIACTGLAILLVFSNVAGQYTVDDQNGFYQFDVNMVNDAVDSKMFDDMGELPIVDLSQATYASAAGGYTGAAYCTWLEKAVTAAGAYDVAYSEDDKSYEILDLYETVKDQHFAVGYSRGAYILTAKAENLEIVNGAGPQILLKTYAEEFDIMVYDHDYKTISYVNADGKKCQLNLSDELKIGEGTKGSIYRIHADGKAELSSVGVGWK